MARTDAAYRARVRSKYNGLKVIWAKEDRWHAWSRCQIEMEMHLVGQQLQLPGQSLVVDVGSAGETYGLVSTDRIDVDLAETRLKCARWPVCANAERLPLASGIADVTVCVGPTINYCSLDETLSELVRITKVNGTLVLHVELSNSWEFAGNGAFRADAAFVNTFYEGKESIWVYSDSLVRRLSVGLGLKLIRARYFHLLSSAAYRLTKRPNLSAAFAHADHLLRHVPGIGRFADSSIYVFQKVV